MSKKELEKIYFRALEKVKAKSIIKDNLSLKGDVLCVGKDKYKLKKRNNLYIYAVGKAALAMAKECEKTLKNRINGGVIISNEKGKLKYLKHKTSTHPIVSRKSIKAGKLLLKSVKSMKKDDVFIFFLSGGASALIEKPIDGLTLGDFKKISSSLLTSGIDIKALNRVRKSISKIKGGKLASKIKAKGSVLVLSDVIGDDLNIIGSAPMNNGKFKHQIIGNNKIALKEAKRYIQNRVEKTKIVTSSLDLSSKDASLFISKEIKKYDEKYESFCLLFGGETTTVVKGDGYGGRNQELALRLLLENEAHENISFLCAGSDGIDGKSDATGAFVDYKIYKLIKDKKLNPKEYLKNSDSNTFFKTLDYDFTIGKTGTNVMDFVIVLKEKGNK